MPDKTAFLFPGQGSQSVGMGHDIRNEFPEAKEIFEQVDDVCQRPISKLCFEGPMDELTLTVNLQPAVMAVNLACLTALNRSGIMSAVSAGHSLGEFSAMTSAGALTPYDALCLVNKRGELMHRESLSNPGSMVAVLGMKIDSVAEIVSQAAEKGVLAVANHNTEEQIVITGDKDALSRALEIIRGQGGKAIPLKVSGAWHCNLMGNAVNELRQFMDTVSFSRPETAILFNATAGGEDDPEKIKDIMARQLISPVRWYDIILKMMEDGVDCFVEVGPKKVLTGLLKKILPKESDTKVYNVGDLKGLKSFIEAIS
ncbi:MAG: ACP S-malonyltransferase [Deltaproteobacteria bacterium]|nr:ACP S-malonyltransferase [Deltaproteobacteria bacterium]